MDTVVNTINGAAAHSVGVVNVRLSGGTIVGQGISGSDRAISVCGGNLDKILSSFGGDISGGNISFGGKSVHALSMFGGLATELLGGVNAEAEAIKQYALKLATLISAGEDLLHGSGCPDQKKVLENIVENLREAVSEIQHKGDEYVVTMENIQAFLKDQEAFVTHSRRIKDSSDNSTKAHLLSMTFTNLNHLKKLSDRAAEIKQLTGYTVENDKHLFKATNILTDFLAKKESISDDMKHFVQMWHSVYEMKVPGIERIIGGASSSDTMHRLSDRLTESQKNLRKVINDFIGEFAQSINGIASIAELMAKDFGKRIDYDEQTVQFLDSFKRLSEYISNSQRLSKIYQYLLELNQDTEVDAREVKDRFISTLKALARDADALDKTQDSKKFAQTCLDTIAVINKYNDQTKIFRDELRKTTGGATPTETMNELFSSDASKINVSALLNPFENLKMVVKKIEFFRNVAVFRSNLERTNKELTGYTQNYTKSVGKTIGDAINKITSEYDSILNDISDNKAGMGLEINMYNESAPNGQMISKEKLKIIYKWQRDARVGLYKTIEAIDLYLLHFTETVTKNPDAVSDLHKLLSATKIIAKWYDAKAGDNLVRMFESFDTSLSSADIDASDFVDTKYATPSVADLSIPISGDRAHEIYERSRRAVEGVVVLKNIISYFITISEKYGDFKGEKNIHMSPSNIYKNLVNYIWVSAFDMNTSGIEVFNDQNELKRVITYEDTKIKLAKCPNIDPEKYGINFNKHSIDKLRILKCLNDLKTFTQNTTGPSNLKQLQNLVSSIFARLGKTEYIFQMLLFGVYDLAQMDNDQVLQFLTYLLQSPSASIVGSSRFYVTVDTTMTILDLFNIDGIVTSIVNIPKNDRSTRVSIAIETNVTGVDEMKMNLFTNLQKFKSFTSVDQLLDLHGFSEYLSLPEDTSPIPPATIPPTGFLRGLFQGLENGTQIEAYSGLSQRTDIVLKYCMTKMLDDYQRIHSSSVFAIDDTYFVLTIKAIAGKVMAVMGINSILKKPDNVRNAFMNNPTRLIMGGAGESDNEIIDEAVELYVRLPLLVEFYRHIFEEGNREYKQESVKSDLDNEQIAYVPEVGSVWSGLILNIFDKSKHILDGIYTAANMKKIVSEINAIYKNYKGSVKDDELVRHITLELVAEINRRYGIIKRQELQQYYRVMNTTKRTLSVNESSYTNNDLDILNESLEFQGKSPSDEFIKLQSTLSDKSVSSEEKINKLTDYRILKEFRTKIETELANGARDVEYSIGTSRNVLTIKDRIRSLKKAIAVKTSMADKYDMIVKAIEEADAMNQSSNDIYLAFHEFVIMPFRTVQQLRNSLELFLLSMTEMIKLAYAGGAIDAKFAAIMNSPLLQEGIIEKSTGMEIPLINAITNLMNDPINRDKIVITSTTGYQYLTFGGERYLAEYPAGVVTEISGGAVEYDTQTLVKIVRIMKSLDTKVSSLIELMIRFGGLIIGNYPDKLVSDEFDNELLKPVLDTLGEFKKYIVQAKRHKTFDSLPMPPLARLISQVSISKLYAELMNKNGLPDWVLAARIDGIDIDRANEFVKNLDEVDTSIKKLQAEIVSIYKELVKVDNRFGFLPTVDSYELSSLDGFDGSPVDDERVAILSSLAKLGPGGMAIMKPEFMTILRDDESFLLSRSTGPLPRLSVADMTSIAAGRPIRIPDDVITALRGIDPAMIASLRPEIISSIRSEAMGALSADARKSASAALAASSGTAIIKLPGSSRKPATNGTIQLLFIKLLTQFCTNSGDLAKMTISTTNRITLDLSEYQKVCEHLIANVKFMVDKFTGLVPSQLIDLVTLQSNDGIYHLEEVLVNRMMNKINRREKERDVLCMDTIHKLMPIVSKIIYDTDINSRVLIKEYICGVGNIGSVNNCVRSTECKPIIRDSFQVYDTRSKIFTNPDDTNATYVSSMLFDPSMNVTLSDINMTDNSPMMTGVIQTFNTLIANYMNDLYDTQSKKIYTKAFASFAGSALVDALNGQSFPDFGTTDVSAGAFPGAQPYYVLPSSQIVLSSTLAYVMKVMSNRVNQINGLKIHEVTSLQEVSPHVLEKYRSLIPMYIRIFKAFVRRCTIYRKIFGKLNTTTGSTMDTIPMIDNPFFNTFFKDHESDANNLRFSNNINSFLGNNNVIPPPFAPPGPYSNVSVQRSLAQDSVLLYLDEVISGMNALIGDAQSLQEELLSTDTTVSLYYDIKRDFTKNYFVSNKDYPFAPLSILSMGYSNFDNVNGGVIPIYGKHITDNKFLYGLRCMLTDDFKLSSQKVPYLKRLITEFNGYTTSANNIDEKKFNDVLQYVSQAASYLYDLRFFNGRALSRTDMLARVQVNSSPILTFQEKQNKASSLTVIESVNAIDSRNKIADWVKEVARTAGYTEYGLTSTSTARNPRSKVMMVNILDLNIVPINVHSLMREIPLVNIYNYAMTFDSIINQMQSSGHISLLLADIIKDPYLAIQVDPATTGITFNGTLETYNDMFTEGTQTNLRFLTDVVVNKVLKHTVVPGGHALGLSTAEANQRLDSKIMHNIIFLTLVQWAIKKKVKGELDFINTRIVTNTNAVNNIITNASVDNNVVDDNMFEF